MAKTAIITGGSDGIGRALVLKLGNDGFNVITCGRSEEKLEKLKELFNSDAKLTTFKGDLTKEVGLDEFISLVNTQTKNIDVIVNNAGVQIGNSVLENSDIEAIQKMYKIHTEVPLKLYKTFFPIMRDKKEGIIMNIVSVVVKGYLKETYGPYTITKYAQYGLSQMMLKEASKHNIKITNVILGGADTNIREAGRPNYLKPEDVATTLSGIINGPKEVFVSEIYLHPQIQLA